MANKLTIDRPDLKLSYVFFGNIYFFIIYFYIEFTYNIQTLDIIHATILEYIPRLFFSYLRDVSFSPLPTRTFFNFFSDISSTFFLDPQFTFFDGLKIKFWKFFWQKVLLLKMYTVFNFHHFRCIYNIGWEKMVSVFLNFSEFHFSWTRLCYLRKEFVHSNF